MLSASPLVTIKLSGGQLQLQGNAANCEIEVNQTGATQFLITGIGATQIKFGNAQGSSETVNGVKAGINVNLPGAGGEQVFALTDATVQGNLNVNFGAGFSIVALGNFSGGVISTNSLTVQGNLNINTGAGETEILEVATTVRHDENINMGAGFRDVQLDENDRGVVTVNHDFNINSNGPGQTVIDVSGGVETAGNIRPAIGPFQVQLPELVVGNNFNICINAGTLNAVLRDTIVGTNLNINCNAGAASIRLFTVEVGNNANINTDVGSDFVELSGFEARGLNVNLGANSDELELFSVTTTVGTNLDGGSGSDTLFYLSNGNSLAHLHIFNFESIA